MQKLIWENSKGERLDLTSAPYGITEWEGFSGIELNVQTQKVPFQDGSVFIDALYEDRTIAVTLAIYDGNNLETRYRLRRELISALNPKAGEGYLIYKNDFIEKRIRAIANNPIFETHNSDMVGTPKASLSWTCCDPYWEDVEETTVKFMGNMRNQIEYDGDVETGVNLEYIGYSASLDVENINENKEIKLQGIGTNRKIDISTLAGKKTIFATDLSKSVLYTGFPFYDICVCNNKLFFSDVAQNGDAKLLIEDENGVVKISLTPYEAKRFTHFELVNYCESRDEYYIWCAEDNKFYSSSDLETWTETLYIYKDVGDWFCRVAVSETWEISNDGVTWTPSTMTEFMYVEDLGYYAIDNNNMYYDADDLSAVSVIKHEDSPYRFNYLLQFGEYVVAQTNYGIAGANIIFKNNVEVTDYIFGENKTLTRVVPFRNDLVGFVAGGGIGLINKNFQNLNGLQYEGQYAYPCCTFNDVLYLFLSGTGNYVGIAGTTENLQDYKIINKTRIIDAIKYEDVYYAIDLGIDRPNTALYISSNLKEFTLLQQLNNFNEGYSFCKNYWIGYDNSENKVKGFEINNYALNWFSTPIVETPNRLRIFGNKKYICTNNGLYESSDLENWNSSCNGENVYDVVVTGNNTIILTDTNYYLNGIVITAPDTFKKVEWSDYYQKFLFISDTACYSSMDGANFELVDGITGNLVDLVYDEKQSLWWILTEDSCYTYYMDLLSVIESSGIEGLLCITKNGVAIINRQIQEIVYTRSTNLIGKMTATSDMSLSLKTGTNILAFSGGDKDVLFLKYRKKYIGV